MHHPTVADIRTAFVLLAGGKSERMGTPKGLLRYGSQVWLMEQLRRAKYTGAQALYLGLGFGADVYLQQLPLLAKALDGPHQWEDIWLHVATNPQPERGPFSTLQTLLPLVPPEARLWVSTVDTPLPTGPALLPMMRCSAWVVKPRFGQYNGHPILLHPAFVQQLRLVDVNSPEARLDVQIKKLPPQHVAEVEVGEVCVLFNLNTPEQWQAYCAQQTSFRTEG